MTPRRPPDHMQVREGVTLALLQIRQEKLKSAFSLLGVVIGVTFLILVVSVVEGMDRYITEDFATQVQGVNTLQIRRAPAVQIQTGGSPARQTARRPRLTMDEADAVRAALSVPARVGVTSNLTAEVSGPDGLRIEGVRIAAISEEVLAIRTLRIEEGRPFSPQEAARGIPVAILGQSVASALFPDNPFEGERIRIRGFPYRVVGVIEEQGTLLGMSMDNLVLVPALSPIRRELPDRSGVGSISVQTLDPADLPIARTETEIAMRLHRRLRPDEPNNFVIETADESLEFWERLSLILFLALPALVGISLVVGGIVIMNIMLMSVLDRTREIGVRLAIGARRRDIITQFLVESATLSGIGALLGIGMGLGLAWLVRSATPLPAAVSLPWVGAGVLLGIVVGIAAGVYPAVRASRLDPVEALRHE